LSNVLVDYHMPWKKEFSREEVHLDLTPLTTAVVNNAVHPDRRDLRGACLVNVDSWLCIFFAITQLCMSDFVCHQERLVEG
jgi:hypothetical protein